MIIFQTFLVTYIYIYVTVDATYLVDGLLLPVVDNTWVFLTVTKDSTFKKSFLYYLSKIYVIHNYFTIYSRLTQKSGFI